MADEERKEEGAQTGEGTPEPQAKKKTETVPAQQDLSKADIGKRVVAAIIDVIISYVIGLIIPLVGGLIGAAYMALRDGFTFEPFVGQSLGKKLLNLKAVVVDTRGNCDYVTSIKRNLPFIIPMIFMVVPVVGWVIGSILWVVALIIEIILVITDENGDRLGDKIADTRVIEIKA